MRDRNARGHAACGYGCTTHTTGGASYSASPFGACARRSDGHVRCSPDDDHDVP